MRPGLSLVAVVCLAAAAADWPQWRGPRRSGATTEQVAATWPSSQPREIWRADIGPGHAPVSVADARVIALGYSGQGDTVWCLDAATGEPLWKFDYPAVARLKGEPGNGAYDGPHAAPLIHGDRVYTLSRDGKVHCLDLAKGNIVWKRDLQADQKAKLPECGFAGSPLIVDGMVIVSVGAAGTALDLATGQTKWQSGPDIAGYGAPVLCTDGKGRKQLLFFAFKDLVAVNPANGERLWALPWPTQYGANVADPVVVGDAVFISSAYGRGCALVDLASGALLWQSKVISSQCSPLVLHEGNVYGFDGYINVPRGQALVCLDPAKGTVHWRQAGMAGQVILAGDKLVMLLITGELVVAKATPKAYQELARGRVSTPEECPVPPTLVHGRLYCRTGKGRLTCLDLTP